MSSFFLSLVTRFSSLVTGKPAGVRSELSGKVSYLTVYMKRLLFTTLMVIVARLALAQPLSSAWYTVIENLPSNFVKAVAVDSAGFLWAGTDAGLARFDGQTFESFNSDLPSLKVKALLNTRRFGLLVLTDLGLSQVRLTGFRPSVSLLIPGSPDQESDKLHFAKTLFQRSDGDIWMGESDAILRWNGKDLTRYPINNRFYNDSFSRSFTFFEDDDGNLLAFSWSGYLFRFDGQQFVNIPFETGEPVKRAYSAVRRPGNKVWFGAKAGIFEIDLSRVTVPGLKPVLVASVPSVHAMASDGDSVVWAGTITEGLYQIRESGQTLSFEEMTGISDVVINDIRLSPDGHIWIAQDEGVHLFYRKLFRSLNEARPGKTIRSVRKVASGGFLIVSFDEIRWFNRTDRYPQGMLLHSDKRDMFDAIYSAGVLWISYRDAELIRIGPEGPQSVLPAVLQSRLTFMTTDQEGSVWGYDERNRFLIRVSPTLTIDRYGPTEGIVSPVNTIRPQPDGSVLIGGTGPGTHLYRYSPVTRTISNISGPLKTQSGSVIEVYDVISLTADSLVLATNHGLFTGNENGFSRLFPSDPTDLLVVRSLDTTRQGDLLAASERGLHVLSGGEWILFNTASGLPAIPVLNQGMICDENDQVVVLSTREAVIAPLGVNLKQTPKPVVNRLEGNRDDDGDLLEGEPFEVYFSTPVYPWVPVVYQVKTGASEDWQPVKSPGYLVFSHPEAGTTTIYLRAQRPGSLWSPVTKLSVVVVSRWYQSPMAMMVMGIAGFSLLTGLLWSYHRYRLAGIHQRQAHLEKMVHQRTAELDSHAQEISRTNEELVKANRLKSDLLAISSHELKNPLTTVIGYAGMLKKTITHQSEVVRLNEIILAASRMLRVVNGLLESEAIESGNRKLIKTDFGLQECLQVIVGQNDISREKKNQTIRVESHGRLVVHADRQAIEEVLDNLLSNAIKYAPRDSEITLSCSKTEEGVKVSVTDLGPGIPDDVRSRLFKRFEKLGSVPTGGEFSSGLGLSIAHDLVVLHGGRIDVRSEKGAGTTFDVFLPIPPSE